MSADCYFKVSSDVMKVNTKSRYVALHPFGNGI